MVNEVITAAETVTLDSSMVIFLLLGVIMCLLFTRR